MDLGVYYGEKRIGEMERVTEGLYTRLSFEYNCHSERRRREESKETLHFVQSDIEVQCHSEGVQRPKNLKRDSSFRSAPFRMTEKSAPLYRLWLSDTPLGLMEERGNSLRFSRRYSKAELKKLPAEGRFQILPDGEKPAPPEKREETPVGPRILQVHVNGKKYTVIRY